MRISIVKSKNAKSIYIIKYVGGNKSYSSTIHKKLGTMAELMKSKNMSEEEVLAWAKAQAKKETELYKKDTAVIRIDYPSSEKIDSNNSNLYNCGYLFLQSIYNELGLDDICKSIKSKYKIEYDFNNVLSRLLYTRILYPGSKYSSYEASKKFIEKPEFDLHQIYRALDVIAKENINIQSQIYKNSLKKINRNTGVLYYDCTNYFFEVEEASGMKQYGVSKEHRPNPIVQMGLFMDGDGLPLAFCINPGNQNEQLSMKPLEENIIKDFNLSKFIVCTDAGLASNSNRIFNAKGSRSYIVTQSLKKLNKHLKEWALNPTEWKLRGSDRLYDISNINEETHYKDIFYKETWINDNDIEQRLIVTYSVKYKNYQQRIRKGQVERAIKTVERNSCLKHNKPNDPARFIDEDHYTKNGEVAENVALDLNMEAIVKEAMFDGYYGVCTTLEDDVESIIKINQGRWEIEESFRIMKTEFKARPVYLSRDNRIKAHFVTCYLSLLLERILEKKLDNKYTTRTIINTIKDMQVSRDNGYDYIPHYQLTDCAKDIQEVFGYKLDTKIIPDARMKKILKQSKK